MGRQHRLSSWRVRFYATHKDKTEREKYLKDYHGEYSGHSGGNDNLTHTRGKGIEFSHGSITAPYAKVTLKWPEAAKRIGELISQNKFLSDADWAAMPEYERKQLARKIVNFSWIHRTMWCGLFRKTPLRTIGSA